MTVRLYREVSAIMITARLLFETYHGSTECSVVLIESPLVTDFAPRDWIEIKKGKKNTAVAT